MDNTATLTPEMLAEMDQLAREHAVDPRRSILLRAPAGSGKTTVLTQRLLCLLAEWTRRKKSSPSRSRARLPRRCVSAC